MTALLFIFGLFIGSFINVITLRYQPEKFLLGPHAFGGRSRCMHCGRELRVHELIPIVSFFLQRGRCRSCREKLTFQYPIVELLSGLIFAFVPRAVELAPYGRIASSSFFPNEAFLDGVWILVFLTLLVISAIDVRLHLIPDEASIFLGILGILLIALGAGHFGLVEGSFVGHYASLFGLRANIWMNHLFALIAASGFFGLVIATTGGKAMGLGDVKLGAAFGWVFGWPDIAFIVVIGFVLGALAGLFSILRGRKTMKSFLAFGPFLALGAAVVFFFGFPLVDAYFRLFAI